MDSERIIDMELINIRDLFRDKENILEIRLRSEAGCAASVTLRHSDL